MTEFHKVTDEELPIVKKWLESHLPDSWRVYGSVREILHGRWYGHIFSTLGWPDIRGVVEDVDESNHPCPSLRTALRFACFYASDSKAVETILERYDWTKPMTLFGANETSLSVAQRIVKEKNIGMSRVFKCYIMQANPGDIEARPIPEGFRLRQIDPDREAEFCASIWRVKHPKSVDLLKAIIAKLPNACLANRDNQCIAFELGREDGTMGQLYTREEYRRQGLGTVLVSNLAQEYFKSNLPAVSWVEEDNPISKQFHLSLGFKEVCVIYNMAIVPPMTEENKDEFLYEVLRPYMK